MTDCCREQEDHDEEEDSHGEEYHDGVSDHTFKTVRSHLSLLELRSNKFCGVDLQSD